MAAAAARAEPLPDQDRLAAIVVEAAGGCYSPSYHWDDDSTIFAAVIVNNEREPAEIEHCLLEEMTEALGLSMAGTGLSSSSFDSEERPFALSPIDDVLVRILYDPRLAPGMAREEVLRRARGHRGAHPVTDIAAIWDAGGWLYQRQYC